MFAERNVEYVHETDSKKMDLVFVGDECASTTSTNLAPPCIVDGDTIVSQNIPVHVYVGKRLGFKSYNVDSEVMLQFMCDLDDLHSEMRRAHVAGQEGNDVVALKKYLTGDRFLSHIKSIDRSIRGDPYYFSDQPTYVDFIAVGYFDMMETIILGPLSSHTGLDFLADAPKLKGVLTAIRGLPSAERLPKLPLVPPPFVMSAERAASWDNC